MARFSSGITHITPILLAAVVLFVPILQLQLFQHPVKIALKQPVLNDSVFFKLAFGMVLGGLRADLAAILQDVALGKRQKGIQPFRNMSK